MKIIVPGKVQKLNVVQNIIPDAIIRTLTIGTVVVLVFDTDTNNSNILKSNITKLHKSSKNGQ